MLKSFCTKDLIYRRKEHKMCSNPIVLYLTTLHTQYSLPAIVIYYAPAVKCYCLFLNKQINLVITYFSILSSPFFLTFSKFPWEAIYCKSYEKALVRTILEIYFEIARTHKKYHLLKFLCHGKFPNCSKCLI